MIHARGHLCYHHGESAFQQAFLTKHSYVKRPFNLGGGARARISLSICAVHSNITISTRPARHVIHKVSGPQKSH